MLLLALALWPVWMNDFFLTNDGPCHLYNARILRDMLLGRDVSFYAEWYSLNPNIEPNWLNHFLLVVFQLVVSPIVAEKLFLTLYVLGFAFAFRYLARSIFPDNGAFVLLAMPFLFHKVFMYGFFNFSASVVLFFLLVGFWLRHFDRKGWRWPIGLSGLLLILGFTHPVSYFLGMGVLFFHGAGQILSRFLRKDEQNHWIWAAQLVLKTSLAAVPSGLLMVLFLIGKGTKSVPSGVPFHTLFHDFLELRSLILFHPGETTWPIVLSILIGLVLVISLLRIRKQPTDHWGVLGIWMAILFAYFFQPGTVAGVGVMPERLQFYPFLVALIWLACRPWPIWFLRTVATLGFVVAAVLFSIRLPNYAITSEAVAEFVSAKEHMRPETTVLMLNYAPEGRHPNDGPVLSKEAYIFMHIAEYLGAMQPHIILNNYEGNTKWFPLRWLPEKDPYLHLVEGPGFEGWLPTVNFEKFRNETGKDVDYVLTWCLTEEFRQYEGVQLMQERLQQDYDETYVSSGKRVRLWERKGSRPAL